MASLVDRDAGAAERVLRDTAELDRGNANLLAALLAHIATDPATITWVMPLTSVCRYLGRITAHIRSLAGEVIYMVTPEHQGSLRISPSDRDCWARRQFSEFI